MKEVCVPFPTKLELLKAAVEFREAALQEFMRLLLIRSKIPFSSGDEKELMVQATILSTTSSVLRDESDEERTLLKEQLECLLFSLQESYKILEGVDPRIDGARSEIQKAMQNIVHNINFLKGVCDE